MRNHHKDSESGKLGGAHKVAALMLSLYQIDKEYVGKLLKRFSETELLRITTSASDLGAISPVTLSNLMKELSSELTSGPRVMGSDDEAQNLLNAAIPGGSINQLMNSSIEVPPPSVWELLSELDGNSLANIVQRELPQIAAYILSQLSTESIAKCLEALPQDAAADILTRIVQIEEGGPIASVCVEEGLASELLSGSKDNGIKEQKVAESLNQLDPELTGNLMDKLRARLPKQAALIASSLFDFKEVVTLPELARKQIMERIKSEDMIIALNGESDEVREAFLSTLGARARKMIEQELNDAQPLPPKTVQAAQKAIANLVVALMRSGAISRAN